MHASNPLPLDAAARDELARKAEHIGSVLGTMERIIKSSFDSADCWTPEFDANVQSAHDALAALLASVRGAEADTRDAERYRFLRDNPLQLRAIDGNAAFKGQWSAQHFDEFTDVAMDDAARAHPPTKEPADV